MKNLGVTLLGVALILMALLRLTPLHDVEWPIPQPVVAVIAMALLATGVTIIVIVGYRKNRKTRV